VKWRAHRLVCIAPHLTHRAIAIPDLEEAIRALLLNRQKKLLDDVGFRPSNSSFRCQANEVG
jgi:hypothetical protein